MEEKYETLDSVPFSFIKEGKILEIKFPGSTMKIYHRFYSHPDPDLDNIVIWERVTPKTKNKEESEEHWIIEKDLRAHLDSHYKDGYIDIKIKEKINGNIVKNNKKNRR